MRIDWELVIAIGFIAFFAYALWRGGSSNPVGTGQLQRQINTIGSRVGSVEQKIDACALSTEVEKLRGEIHAMEGRVASSGELIVLQDKVGQVSIKVAGVDARLDGIEKATSRTDAGVARIEGYFLEKGIKG